MKTPLISVIIPTYNYSSYLPKAITSVLNQNWRNLEILICDDGSTDCTQEIIKPYLKHKNIKYLYQPHTGLSAARNLGIKHASGEYLAFLDSDDYWLPQKLTSQMRLFQHSIYPNLGLVYCFHYWTTKGKKNYKAKIKTYKGSILDALLQGNIITGSGSSVLVKRECFDQVGNFNESLSSCEDWDMWLRIAASYQIDFVPQYLVMLTKHYQRMSKNKTQVFSNRLRIIIKNLHLLPKTFPSGIKYFLKSILYLIEDFSAPLYFILFRIPQIIIYKAKRLVGSS